MNTIAPQRQRFLRPMALLLSALLMVPFLNACGESQTNTPPPPVDDTRGGTVTNPPPTNQPQAKKGLSTGQKVAITLAGAAALYYLYNKNKNKQQQGAQGKYYLSKNGRVYYRDAQNRPHWVTPPPGGIQVSEEEARQYREFQGYNNRPTGRDLTGLAEADAPVPVPAQ
ncbi:MULTISPECIES: hypothetical protein [unclassified Coleofasciculus]|uniref:hypothetical protein n=1 Tax=Cyanophyceae TaxID=3028117 RepID=UPI00168655D5|nr:MULTISPECIES: hypothetical protein [unclassified Coleofasciculus]MBD1889141.1 hypothetical protein [Coleofasciculus sp. FACHB-SPT9]MBD1893630.1 hypothetical protein [Coleofasciculus sp. FACHB-129]MBD2084903.1 hypothetical protein [Coleofasciculus sp. FACHB-542]